MGRGDSQAICTSLTESQWQPAPLTSTSSIPPSFCPSSIPPSSSASPFVYLILYYHNLLFLPVFSLHYSVCQTRCASHSQTKPGDREDLKITLMWGCFSVSQGCHYQLASSSANYYYHISFLLCHSMLLPLMLLLFLAVLHTTSGTMEALISSGKVSFEPASYSKGQRSGSATVQSYRTDSLSCSRALQMAWVSSKRTMFLHNL